MFPLKLENFLSITCLTRWNGTKSQTNTAALEEHPNLSSLCSEYAPEGSKRRQVEESTMDFLQIFLFHLEDVPNVNVSGYAEPLASCENTGTEVAESHVELLLPDLTPAGVMGWLTVQKKKKQAYHRRKT